MTSFKNNAMKPKGSVIAIIEENGKTWVEHVKPNLIVDGAREAMSKLIAEADVNYKVQTFKLGTKGNKSGNILDPEPPVETDTDLKDSDAFSMPIVKHTYLPSDPDNISQVQFEMTLEQDQGNGDNGAAKAYTEAALVCKNNKLFARETFPAIVKTDKRRITFKWTIIF